MWAFLRREAKAGGYSTLGRRHFASIASEDLADEYSYLSLSAAEIDRGLKNSRQADDDTAKKFGISPNTLRSMLSKWLRSPLD